MKRILVSLSMIGAVAAIGIGATGAFFSDTATSTGNTFTAGTLDLKVDGLENSNAKFTVTNFAPEAPAEVRSYTLHNAGTIPGFVDLSGIAFSSAEDGCNVPETSAGDGSCAANATDGELAGLLNVKLENDITCDTIPDSVIYNGLVSGIAASYDLDYTLGADRCIIATVTWPTSVNDNRGQGDSLTLGLVFELDQVAD